ncbi:hypothetical protein BU15DRAFT_78972 [Melanogaster broomeanus]|nr:hypothetical protein BU15DRAFT_78972 [Melanogaster broomeanus]
MSLQPFVSLYQYALEPVAPFSWFGLGISSLDLAAAFRLCYVLRQMRQNLRNEHVKLRATDSKLPALEERSFVRDALATLTVVYGGEAIAGPLLGTPPSFMISGLYPMLYILMQAVVDAIPVLPSMSIHTELPLSFLDGHARAVLLCSLIPPAILGSSSAVVASSPWALLLSSFVITNGGFFITNLVSFMDPTPLALTTPAELQPYGWTATDLWSAPLVTGLYATLTHAQPFWAEVHAVLAAALGGRAEKAEPLDAETARSACALLLATVFAARAAKTFGGVWKQGVAEKIKMN